MKVFEVAVGLFSGDGQPYRRFGGRMSSPLLPSALDARTQAFPVLSVSQIDRIRSCSRSRQVAAGDILFDPGDGNAPFYVLLSRGMATVHPAPPRPHLIAHTLP